jgi:hypothetical protein
MSSPLVIFALLNPTYLYMESTEPCSEGYAARTPGGRAQDGLLGTDGSGCTLTMLKARPQ